MVTPKPKPQSDATPKAAEAQLRELIARIAPTQRRLFGAVRRWLRQRLPAAQEVVYEYRGFFVISYTPSGRGYEGALALRVSADGVHLWFNRGKELPDPEKRLRGSGRQTRSMPIERSSTLNLPAVARLIDEAIARSPAPLAGTAHGTVVIRDTAARRRS